MTNRLGLLLSFLALSIHAHGKNVYMYHKSHQANALGAYRAHKERFFQELFGPEYTITLVKTLKDLTDFEFVITDEVPKSNQELSYLSAYPKEKVLLFTFEPPLLEVRSNDPKLHHNYSRVFTWNDDLIDNKKYFKVRFPWMDPRPMLTDRPSFNNKKLCVLVAGNLNNTQPHSNYGERKKVVEFFESLGTDEFDLYGYGWKEFGYKCFKGPVPPINDARLRRDRRLNKIHTLKNYKFDICYENAKGLNGWVSERIFEAFAAGCVPVYLGAKNIEQYIPKSCFIAREDFASNQELYLHLKTMSEDIYEEYLRSIREYLASEAAYQVSTPYYLTHIRKILKLYNV